MDLFPEPCRRSCLRQLAADAPAPPVWNVCLPTVEEACFTILNSLRWRQRERRKQKGGEKSLRGHEVIPFGGGRWQCVIFLDKLHVSVNPLLWVWAKAVGKIGRKKHKSRSKEANHPDGIFTSAAIRAIRVEQDRKCFSISSATKKTPKKRQKNYKKKKKKKNERGNQSWAGVALFRASGAQVPPPLSPSDLIRPGLCCAFGWRNGMSRVSVNTWLCLVQLAGQEGGRRRIKYCRRFHR